jgi:hypothetical protein
MNEVEFWKTIDESRNESGQRLEAQAASLLSLLKQRSIADVIAFERTFQTVQAQAYRADLWGAAFIIWGGCSDDGFDYFLNWLISRGLVGFRQAIAHPDDLADVPGIEDSSFEEFGYAAMKAYRELTGKDDFASHFQHIGPRKLIGDTASWSKGGDLDLKKAMALYPRLMKRFWD